MKEDINKLWHRVFNAVSENARFQSRKYSYDSCATNTAITKSKKSYCGAISFAITGLLALLTGFLIVFLDPYNMVFKYKSTFGPGGEMFNLWATPPVELYLKVYLWNVTNKEEYMSGKDDKLKIVDVGPYVYRELLVHDNVTFNDNGTLSTIPRHPLVWVPELSEGRMEDDILILPNIALLSIAHVVSDESYFTRLGLNMLIRQTQSEPLVTMTAKEFMFSYKSTLMTLGNKFMPNWIYFDRLGLIDRMYDFDGDYETVFTGETTPTRGGLIDTYRGSQKLPQWDLPCGNVHGASDGTKFDSYIQPNDTLFFYRKSQCRAKYLVRVGETEKDGFHGYVYNYMNNTEDNGKYNESNKCFCKDDNCLPDGLLDVRDCYYGFPIALSNPHFFEGDEVLSSKVEGMKPAEEHRSYFVIEPQSGVPLELSAKFQINLALKNIKTIANCELFSDMYLPLLWAEFKVYSLPDFFIARLRLYLQILPVLLDVTTYLSFVFGALLLIYSIYRCTQMRKRVPLPNSPWIQDDLHYIERKLSSYIPEKKAQMSAKELEVYFSSLVTPLNQEITFQDFAEASEADV